jgi:hypothetical protein
MATKILLKKSTTGGASPLIGDLDQGELAINLVDRKIYTKNGANAIIAVSGAYVDSVAPANGVEGDLWYDTANNLLKSHNGSAFVASGFSTLATLEDVVITTPADNEVLAWDTSTSKFINQTPAEAGLQPAGSYSLTSHTHTFASLTSKPTTIAGYGITDAFDGVYSSLTSIPTTFTPSAHTLDSHSNVTVSAIGTGELLKWSGTAWINNTLAEAGIAAASHTHTFASLTSKPTTISGYGITDAFDGVYSSLTSIPTTFAPSAHTLGSHSDVTLTTIATGELLKWSGTAWINNTLAEAGISATGHTHVAADITDFDTEVSNNTSVAANTAKVSNVTTNLTTTHNASTVVVNSSDGTNATINAATATTAGIMSEAIFDQHVLNNAKLTNVSTNLGYTTAATTGTVTSSDGTNATLPAATTSLAGLLTGADKTLLNSALQAESDTLASVTGRGASTATAVSLTNATASTTTANGALVVTGGVGIGGNLNVGGSTIITGNLTVNGTTTSVNSNTVNIGDSIITLNADEAGAPSQNAGFEIERGTSANVSFIFDEATDSWDFNSLPVQNIIIDGGTY